MEQIPKDDDRICDIWQPQQCQSKWKEEIAGMVTKGMEISVLTSDPFIANLALIWDGLSLKQLSNLSTNKD